MSSKENPMTTRELKGFTVTEVSLPQKITVNDVTYFREGNDIIQAVKALKGRLTANPTAFNWTPAMLAVFPNYQPSMSALLAIWAAMSEAAVYSASGDAADGWVKWEGGKCPVLGTTRVEVKFQNGTLSSSLAAGYDWVHRYDVANIIAYRVLS